MNELSLIGDLFDKSGDFEVCLMSSYSLNLNFLENYLLSSNGLSLCDEISIFTDQYVYEGLFEDHPAWLNKKYLVTRIRSVGVFHPKIYLLASEKKVIFALGSANLSREGLTSNLELLSIFEVSKDNTQDHSLLMDIIEYFENLARLSGSQKAATRVRTARNICSGFVREKSQPSTAFVHNLDNPLIEKLINLLGNQKPSSIKILSPFFDKSLSVVDSILKNYPGANIDIFLQQARTDFPVERYSKYRKSINLWVYHNIDRYIHGKAIVINTANKSFLYQGSANCTKSAMLSTINNGNFEVGLFGEVNHAIVDSIFKPLDIEPQPLNDTSQLKVVPSDMQHTHRDINEIDLILEVEKIGDEITFTLDKSLLKKMTLDTVEANNFEQKIKVNLKQKKISNKFSLSYSSDFQNIKTPFFVKIHGRSEEGSEIQSNSSWVISLESNSENNMKKKYRQLYSNPFELGDFLTAILEQGDEDELKDFFLSFNVPLDLLLPPHLYTEKRPWQSEGNLEGGLSKRSSSLFTEQKMIEVFIDFFEKLKKKLSSHIQNPQIEKINNFIYIISLIFSLIDFLNVKQLEKYSNKEEITRDDWATLRAFYNMMLSVVDASWHLLWDEENYRGQINRQLTIRHDGDEDTDIHSFEDYLVKHGYIENILRLGEISQDAVQTIMYFKQQKSVRVQNMGVVKPKLFARDVSILRSDEVKDYFLSIENRLKKYNENNE